MSIKTLINTKNKLYTQLLALDIVSSMKTKDGGKGSGNFGHSGRPGEVGGSASEGSSISIEAVKDFMKNNNISNKELMSNYSLYPNEVVADNKGRKIRHITLEYDWNSSKSFIQTQLKSLALKNKLYGETANKKE